MKPEMLHAPEKHKPSWLAPISDQEYNEFRNLRPENSTPFNDLDVMKTLADSFGGKLTLWRLGDQGVIPIIRRRVSANMIPIRYFGPIWTNPENIDQNSTSLMKALLTKGILKYRWTTPKHTESADRSPTGVKITDSPTCILSLDNLTPEGIPTTAATRSSEKIRSALRNELLIEPAAKKDVVETLPSLLQVAYGKNNQTLPYPHKLFLNFWERFHADSRVRMISAKKDGKTLGVLAAIMNQDSAYSIWYARSYARDEDRNMGILESMIGEVAIQAKAAGCKEYDLGGGTDGIIEFKRRLGARVQVGTQIELLHPVGNALNLLRKHLPNRQ